MQHNCIFFEKGVIKYFGLFAFLSMIMSAFATESFHSEALVESVSAPDINAKWVAGPTENISESWDSSVRDADNHSFAAKLVPLYRYWNSGIGDHFYTTNWSELGDGGNGWVFEGVAGKVYDAPQNNTLPLYRYWNSNIGDHFYTTNWGELGAGKNGWKLEGIQGYIHPNATTGTLPLFRYWNSNIGDHFYTTNWSELGAGKNDWKLEGIQGYIYPQ